MSDHPHAAPPLQRGTMLLLATTAGVTIANIYFNQPLLDQFRQSFPQGSRWVGVVPTLTQLGFALGVLFLAPLGDRLDRRKLILAHIGGLIAALAVAASAPSMAVLATASLAIGFIGIIPQQAVPFAAELAPPAERGQAVGTVMSGLFIGILLARTAAGFVGQYLGWRAVFVASIVALLLLTAVIQLRLPTSRPTSKLPYAGLMRSLWTLIVELPELRVASLTSGALFASFSVFWSVLALLLAGPPFHYGPRAAGLFGIVGAAGALVAPIVGKSADRRGPNTVVSLAIGLVAASFVILSVSASHVVGLILGVIVLDVGVQAGHISNQSKIYALKPEARSRINTVYMTAYFVGGAIGSAASTAAWAHFGWVGVCVTGIFFAAVAGIAHRTTLERVFA